MKYLVLWHSLLPPCPHCGQGLYAGWATLDGKLRTWQASGLTPIALVARAWRLHQELKDAGR